MVLMLAMLSANEPATPSVPLVPVAPEVASADRVLVVSVPPDRGFIPAVSEMPVLALATAPEPNPAWVVMLTQFTETAAPIVTLLPLDAEPSATDLPSVLFRAW